MAATLDAIVVERPQPTPKQPQHLCLDKAYDNPTGEKRFPARRWVVERTLVWLSKCRALLIRYDKHSANFLGLLQLACALLWFRRPHRLSLLR